MVLLQQKLLVLHNQQWPTDATGISVDTYLTLANVSDHGHLGHDDIHLTSQPPQRVHQVLRLLVDAHPTAVHKDLGRTSREERERTRVRCINMEDERRIEENGS